MAIAYFLTWTTYGTWLPGDSRGWFQKSRGIQLPNPDIALASVLRQKENAVLLSDVQRQIVHSTITQHSSYRKWTLHGVNCRTNHVHVVVTATTNPQEVRSQFKTWCTRKLNESFARDNWWSERGWDVYLDEEESVQEAIYYVLHRQ